MEIYTVDQDADSKTSNCTLSFSENNDTPGNIRINDGEVRLCNHCCHVNAMNIKYSVCVLIALVVHHAMCMRHIVFCGMPSSTILFHLIS